MTMKLPRTIANSGTMTDRVLGIDVTVIGS
jgi:hypothetical protein